MRLFLLLIVVSFCSTVCAQSQGDLNDEARSRYELADKELNEIYKEILVQYKSDTLFIKNLKISQRIWLKFRDAELKMKYPDREVGYYGSVHPMCVANYLEQLTSTRVNTLKKWLEGAEEGDVSSGSIKIMK